MLNSMNSNPFVRKTNDLFIMLLTGLAITVVDAHIFPLTVQREFLILLGFGFFSGLVMMNSLVQSIEWALFFFMGVQMASVTPLLINNLLAQGGPIGPEITPVILGASHKALFLMSSWIIALPTGFMLQKLIMEHYYRKTLY